MPAKLRTPRAAPLSCTRGETTAPETRFLSVLSFKNVNPTTRTIRERYVTRLSFSFSRYVKKKKRRRRRRKFCRMEINKFRGRYNDKTSIMVTWVIIRILNNRYRRIFLSISPSYTIRVSRVTSLSRRGE